MPRTKSLEPVVGVGTLSSPLEVGAGDAPETAERLVECCRRRGWTVLPLGSVDTPERAVAAGRRLAEERACAAVLRPVSWFEDYLVLDMLEEAPLPLFLWPRPGMETGALCGTQQLTAFLTQLDAPFVCAFGPEDDAACLRRMEATVRAAALFRLLRRARVGMAGSRINGMTHTSPNEFALKRTIGPRVVRLDLPLLLRAAEEADRAEATRRWKELRDRAGCCRVDDAEGVASMQVHAALTAVVEEHGLDTLTVGCYPHLMGKVCLAASLLADEGVPFACEGDVHGAVGMLMLQRLTGEPVHNTDWLDPLDDGTVVFTHCGSGSFSLAQCAGDITIDSVRLMGQGACALFPARTGPVTLVNITPGRDGYLVGLLAGHALPAEMVFPGNPARVRFSAPTERIMDGIHASGLGHHWMIGYGDVASEIRAWAAVAAPDVTLVEPGSS